MAAVKRTFGSWIPRYVSNLQNKNYSENTIEAYERVLKLFARFMKYLEDNEGEVPENTEVLEGLSLTAELTVSSYELLDFFTLIRKERDLSAASIHLYDSALSSFYRYLVVQNQIETNPMTKVDRPKIKDREIKYLRHKQVMEFIDALKNPRNSLLVRVIYTTGMRISEVCPLKIEQIDFEETSIRVHGKGGKIRVVFADALTLKKIRELIGERTSGYVFEGRNGDHISPRTVQHIFEKYAPPGITPHKIRHSFASELYRNSHDIRVVQDSLGHTSIKTTEIYVHTDIDERKKIYRQYFPLAND